MDLSDMILVSVDDHVVEPPSMQGYVRDHVPARFKARVPGSSGGLTVRRPG